MDDEEFDMMFFFVSKTSKNRSKHEKRTKVLGKENFFEKRLFVCTFFDFCQKGKDISLIFWTVIPLGSIKEEEVF